MARTANESSDQSGSSNAGQGMRPSADPSEGEKQQRSWYYHGYPDLALWMASSNDFFLLRKFSKVNARCLLYLQHQIAVRENELDRCDAESRKVQPFEDGGCSNFDEDEVRFPRRTELIQDLCALLQQYNDLVNSFTQVRQKPTARVHHRRNLNNYFDTYPETIDPSEQHFRNHEGDLFPIISRMKTPLRILLERWQSLRFLFRLGKRDDRMHSSTVTYHSDTGLGNLVCAVIVVIGLGLLLGTMWWLNNVDDRDSMLGIITGSIIFFTAWLWAAAGPRPFEILLGAAAYSAVLYVCLQVSSSGGGSIG